MAYTKNHIMHIIAIAIAIIVLIAAVAGLLAIGKQKRLKAKAQECAKEVQQFQDKLQKLTDPSHFFTDEELLQFKRECAPLLDEINELYDRFHPPTEVPQPHTVPEQPETPTTMKRILL